MWQWTTQVTSDFHGISPFDIFRTFLMEYAVGENKTVYGDTIRGYTSTAEVRTYIENYPKTVLLYQNADPESDTIEIYCIDERNGLLQAVYSDTHVDISILSIDNALVKQFSAGLRAYLSEAPMRGTVHMLALESSYYLTELGEVHDPLERGNYTTEVLTQYDRVIEDLLTETPSGRLTILDGEAGTGKSYLIRGIISAIRGLFIYIPASVAGKITGPDIVPVLLREKDKDVPIVLLMEDADSSLATRQLDNVSRLSDLLNMSDGILGDMSDLRIIATTNARKADIDKAVLRPGRLNEHIQLEPLKFAHAHAIFERLLGYKHFEHSYSNLDKDTLADVYREARKYGWKPPTVPKRKKRFPHNIHFD